MNTFSGKRNTLFGLSIICAAGALSPSLNAATWIQPDRGSWMGAYGLAMGGALVARTGRSDFGHANPAGPAFEQKYTLGFGYSTAGDQLKAQIIDTKSSQIGGGISFAQRTVDNVGEANDSSLGNFNRLEHVAQLSLMSKATDTVAIGLAASHRYFRPLGAALPSTSFISGDLGVLVKLSPQWNLGLAGLDLIADDTGFVSRTLSVGVSGVLIPGLTVAGQADFLQVPAGSEDFGFVENDSRTNFALAAEYVIATGVSARASYRMQPAWQENFVGLGLGYFKDTFGLEYGMRLATKASGAQYHALSLSVDI